MSNEMFNQIPAVNSDPAYGFRAEAFSIDYIKGLYDRMGSWTHMRNYTADVLSYGQRVTIPSVAHLTAVDINPTTGAYAYNNTQVVGAQVTVDKQKAVPFSINRTTMLQAKADINAILAAEAARGVRNAIDADMAALCSSLTTNYVGTLGSDLSDTLLLQAVGKLVGQHVDPAEDKSKFCFILPASQFAVVAALKGYNSYRITAQDTDTNGTKDVQLDMYSLYGIPVYFRGGTELTVSGGAIGGLFYADSVGVAVQRMPSTEPFVRIPGTIQYDSVCWSLYGINLTKEPLACQLRCK